MVLPRVNPHFKPLSPCLKRRNNENANKDRKSVRWSGSLEEIHYIPPREKKGSRKRRVNLRNDEDMVDELLLELTAPIATPEDVSLETTDLNDSCSTNLEQRDNSVRTDSFSDKTEAQELQEFEGIEIELEKLNINTDEAKRYCGISKELDDMEKNTLKILRDCERELNSMDLALADTENEQQEDLENCKPEKLETKKTALPSKAEIARLKILEKILFDTSLTRGNKKSSQNDSDSESVDSEDLNTKNSSEPKHRFQVDPVN